ncbi:MAG: sulfatase-like hydrolase/transferase, partial [Acidobacteriota bacterium]
VTTRQGEDSMASLLRQHFHTAVTVLAALLAISTVMAGSPSRVAGRDNLGVRVRAGPVDPPLERPNIILIVTDDQRWDTIGVDDGVMPLLAHGLRRESVVFTNAVVSSPLCCPVRSSILSGGFAVHHHGVWTNTLPNGSAPRFQDARSLSTLLRDQGYFTVFVGKYMNNLGKVTGRSVDGTFIERAHYVPPGWDAFLGYVDDSPDWFDYRIDIGTSTNAGPMRGLLLPAELGVSDAVLVAMSQVGFPQSVRALIQQMPFSPAPHVSEFERDLTLTLLDDMESHPDRPFFLYLGLAEPHGPATPAPGDVGLFPDFFYDDRGWGEEDLSDKPAHIQRSGEGFSALLAGEKSFRKNDPRLPEEFFGDQWRSLRGVDRTVDALLTRLRANPALARRTVIMYSSDHGVQWGEHRLLGKKKLPYEESLRVPFLLRVPGVPPASRTVWWRRIST